MGKEAQIAIKINQIKNMKANKINKSIVLDFDNLNTINNLANSTRLMYLVLLRFLLIYSEGKKKSFKELSGEDLREFTGLLKERKFKSQMGPKDKFFRHTQRLSQGSLNIYIQLLKRFYKYLYNTGRDTPEVIKKADLRTRIEEFKLTSADLPTEEEIQAMIDATQNPLYKAILAVAYDSGMRISDILDLKVRDLIVTDNEVRLRFYISKLKRPLLYGMGSSVGYLMNWYNCHPTKIPEDPLFCTNASNWKGKRMSYFSIYGVIKNLAKKAGINKKVSCHTFRHCATARDKRNYNHEELRVLRGWSRNSNMPLRYAPISNDEVFRKKQVLEGKMSSEPIRKVIDARKCPRCRNTVMPDAMYCSICGQLLSNRPGTLNEILKNNPVIMQQIIDEVQKSIEKKMNFQKLAEERFKVMVKC
ncbi:MAG: tyrosine-type recombinase/integrase [Candidatus Aminicenantes bacterium]|jgi:integrase